MARRTLIDVGLDLAYRSCRPWFLLVVPIVSFVLTWALLVTPGLLVLGVIAELEATTVAELIATLVVTSGVASLLGIGTGLRSLRDPIEAQLRGEPTDPREVWLAATAIPSAVTGRTVMLAAPATGVAVVVLGTRHPDEMAMSGWVALGGIVAIGTALMTALWVAAGRIMLRPIVDEVVRASPEVATTTRRRTTQLSVLIGVAAFTYLGGSAAAAAATLVDDPASRVPLVGAAIVASIAWAAFVAYELITHPLFEPLDELTTAARRVGAGAFDRPLYPTAADEFSDLMVAFNDMQQGLYERELLRSAFASYVDASVADRIVADDREVFVGDEVEVTVMVLDVRGFTPFAASVSAREALTALNTLFEVVVPLIRAEGGHANKYLGDGLLAAFGAPQPLADHADRAVAAARRIRAAVDREFGGKVQVGIGLNTGTVIAGTVGGGGKLEFTLIGDAVNVAARVEELTKRTGDTVLLTDATLAASTLGVDATVARGEFTLRGTDATRTVHGLTAG